MPTLLEAERAAPFEAFVYTRFSAIFTSHDHRMIEFRFPSLRTWFCRLTLRIVPSPFELIHSPLCSVDLRLRLCELNLMQA
jgi:hypothetical protein